MARRIVKNTFKLPTGEGIRKELVKWFREQRKQAMAALRNAVPDLKAAPDRDDVYGGGRQPVIPSIQWDYVFPPATEQVERFAPKIEAIWDRAGRDLYARVGKDPDGWSVEDPARQKAIDDAAMAFCAATLATTSQDLDRAIEQTRDAIRQGASIRVLTRSVNEVFDKAETWRARRIATSEASRAYHAAELDSAKASGVVAGLEWLLSEDACPLCQTVARRAPRVPLGQPFAVIGDHPDYKDIRHPPLHPGCQCSVLEVMKPEYGGPRNPEWAATLDQPKPEEIDEQREEDYEPIPFGESPFGRWEDPGDDAPPLPPAPEPAPPPPPMRAAQIQTRDDAQQVLERIFPKADIKLKKLALDGIKVIAERLETLAEKWPEIASDLRYIGTERKNGKALGQAYATASLRWQEQRLAFNPKYWNNLAELRMSLSKGERNGFNPAGCNTPEYVISHEWGHLADGWLRSKLTIDDREPIIRAMHMPPAGATGPWFPCEYAKTDDAEFFAEYFAASMHSPSNEHIRKFAAAVEAAAEEAAKK